MDASYLAHDRLKELLRYDPETGVFQWNVRPGRKMRIGQEAGSLTANGYVQIKLDKRRYLAHRLAWLYVHGVWPSGQIDHVNGRRTENAIQNLRDVPRSVNCENKRGPSGRSRTGLLGVTVTGNGKYQAQIKTGGVYRYLGVFDDEHDAHAAYVQAKRKLHVGCTI